MFEVPILVQKHTNKNYESILKQNHKDLNELVLQKPNFPLEQDPETYSDNEQDQDKQQWFKPQHTYEVWNLKPFELSEDVIEHRGKLSKKKLKELRQQQLENYKIRKISKPVHHTRRIPSHIETMLETVTKSTRQKVEDAIYGLEQIPSEFLPRTGLRERMETSLDFTKNHVANLSQLLHININRKQWDVAYKLFCLLIRFNCVDLRSLWPLGIHIIERKRNSLVDNFDNLHVSGYTSQDIQFLEWLMNFYSSDRAFKQGTNFRLPPVWRDASRTHVAMYAKHYLWKLVTTGDHVDMLLEKLQEMMLRPPFVTDGESWFLYAMVNLQKAEKLADLLNEDSSEPEKNNVFKYINNCKKHLKESQHYKFEFNSRMFERQLDAIERRMYSE